MPLIPDWILGERLELALLQDIKIILEQVLAVEKQILQHLATPKAVALHIKYLGGVKMPVTLTDGGKGSTVIASPSETDAAGNPVTVDPTKITWSASDPTALTLTPNPTTAPVTSSDGQTVPPGGCEIAAAGTAGHLGAFQLTESDTSNGLTAVDTVTVVAGSATALGINFAPPV